MKKILIPTILAATVLVAGMFAVEKASSKVKAQGPLNQIAQFAEDDLELGIRVSCTRNFLVHYVIGDLDDLDEVEIDVGALPFAEFHVRVGFFPAGSGVGVLGAASGTIGGVGGETITIIQSIGNGADGIVTVQCASGGSITGSIGPF